MKKILRTIMLMRGFTNAVLAEKCGYSTPSGVSTKLERADRIQLDTLMRLLRAMDCELVIRSKLSDKGEWVVK